MIVTSFFLQHSKEHCNRGISEKGCAHIVAGDYSGPMDGSGVGNVTPGGGASSGAASASSSVSATAVASASASGASASSSATKSDNDKVSAQSADEKDGSSSTTIRPTIVIAAVVLSAITILF